MTFNDLSIREQFIVSRWAYSVGAEIIEDFEYTRLLNYMKEQFPADEYVNRSWSSDPCPTALLEKIGRKDLIAKVLLGDHTESIPTLNTEFEVQNELKNFVGVGTLSMKHDGFNMQASYYNGKLVTVKSRGRSCDAFNADTLASLIPAEIPAMGKVKVVCEATVNSDNFAFCKSMFNNVSQRSAVSSLLARPEYVHLLDMHAFDVHGYQIPADKIKFDVLSAWGFKIPQYFIVHNYDDILVALKELSDYTAFYKSPTDGAVFDGPMRRAIRLLAWEEPIFQSYVTGYLEQFGIYRISPSVLIYPVLRKGTTQRRINITNWQRILDYELKPGSPIAFRVASSAIADFDDVATRLLREQWVGKEEEYQQFIRDNEEIKKCQQNMSLLGS